MAGTDKRLGPPDDPANDDEVEDVLEGRLRERLEAFIPDMVKRTVTAGVSALVSTEEGIRKITKDLQLPKDVAGYLATTASSTKDELMRIIAREVREFLQTVNLSEEIAKVLTMLSLEVKTEIRFIPNDKRLGGVQPDVKARVNLKRAEDEAGASRRRRRRRRRGTAPDEE